MTSSKHVKVFDLELSEELFPKLYKLGLEDKERLEKVIRMFRVHCHDVGSAHHIVEIIEKSEPVKILGEVVDAISFPAIYCWYRMNPADFEKFFGETVKNMWAGEKGTAFKMVEEYLEKEIK